MRTAIRLITALLWVTTLHTGPALAAPEKAAQAAADPAKDAAMEALQTLGSPGEPHQALEPFVGTWTYTAAWWMSPEQAPQTMTGLATNTLIFGGRFLKQEVRGDAEGYPPFEGLGFIGYDNLRKEYQSVWFDSMMTGMMRSTAQFDAATQTLAEQGDFSCPVTGETHRKFRTAWTLVDPDHTTYESYSFTPEGLEFKTMEIRYTRAP